MALGGVIPGYVLAWVGFNSQASAQTALAEQGILWLVTIIPAVLMFAGLMVINRYELTDERMDSINREIESER
ncbi:MAG: MFS transporter [Bacteroidaceae bacterium]|nr:MFS transporter [Bacteroidaceae bacterium]